MAAYSYETQSNDGVGPFSKPVGPLVFPTIATFDPWPHIFERLGLESYCSIQIVCPRWRRMCIFSNVGVTLLSNHLASLSKSIQEMLGFSKTLASYDMDSTADDQIGEYFRETLLDIQSYMRLISSNVVDASMQPPFLRLFALVGHRLRAALKVLKAVRILSQDLDLVEFALRRSFLQVQATYPFTTRCVPMQTFSAVSFATIIADKKARIVWEAMVAHRKTPWVSAHKAAMRLGLHSALTPHILLALDFPTDHIVTPFKWNAFMTAFGPFDHLEANITRFVANRGFCGFINRAHAERLLAHANIKTVLLRASRTQPFLMALSYKPDSGPIVHITNNRNFWKMKDFSATLAQIEASRGRSSHSYNVPIDYMVELLTVSGYSIIDVSIGSVEPVPSRTGNPPFPALPRHASPHVPSAKVGRSHSSSWSQGTHIAPANPSSSSPALQQVVQRASSAQVEIRPPSLQRRPLPSHDPQIMSYSSDDTSCPSFGYASVEITPSRSSGAEFLPDANAADVSASYAYEVTSATPSAPSSTQLLYVGISALPETNESFALRQTFVPGAGSSTTRLLSLASALSPSNIVLPPAPQATSQSSSYAEEALPPVPGEVHRSTAHQEDGVIAPRRATAVAQSSVPTQPYQSSSSYELDLLATHFPLPATTGPHEAERQAIPPHPELVAGADAQEPGGRAFFFAAQHASAYELVEEQRKPANRTEHLTDDDKVDEQAVLHASGLLSQLDVAHNGGFDGSKRPSAVLVEPSMTIEEELQQLRARLLEPLPNRDPFTVSYDLLRTRPSILDCSRLEKYLSEEDFFRLFEMDKQSFDSKLPATQSQLKRSLDLL